MLRLSYGVHCEPMYLPISVFIRQTGKSTLKHQEEDKYSPQPKYCQLKDCIVDPKSHFIRCTFHPSLPGNTPLKLHINNALYALACFLYVN